MEDNVNFYLIESLESASSIEVDWGRLDFINENWNEFTELEYYAIIQELKDNELDPVTHGRNFNQTDIRKHLNKLK